MVRLVDIERLDSDRYGIELAVANFTPDEIKAE